MLSDPSVETLGNRIGSPTWLALILSHQSQIDSPTRAGKLMNHHHPLSFCRRYKGGRGGKLRGGNSASPRDPKNLTQPITKMARPLSRNGSVAGRETGSRGSLSISTIPTIERSAKGTERGREEARGESCQTTRQILGNHANWSLV